MRTVVGDEGDQLLSPEVVAQRTTSYQVQEGTLVRSKVDFPREGGDELL
jgi:hypothetical protein